MNWLKGAFTRNLLLKLSALVCAVVAWVYVDGFVPAERTIEAEVHFRWSGADKTVSGSSPRKVNVTIRGPSRVVRGLRVAAPWKTSIVLDNDRARRFIIGASRVDDVPPAAFHLVHFREDDFDFGARGLTVVAIDPSGVAVKIGPSSDAPQEGTR